MHRVIDPQGSIFLRIFPIPKNIGWGRGEEKKGKRRERGGREGGRERVKERDREKTLLAFLN